MKSIKKLSLGLALISGASQTLQPVLAQNQTTDWTQRNQDEVNQSVKEALQEGSYYQIQWGDTLTSIARALDLKLEDLTSINQIQNPNFIKAGAVLILNDQDHTLAYADSMDQIDQAQVLNQAQDEEDQADKVDAASIIQDVQARIRALNSAVDAVAPLSSEVVDQTQDQLFTDQEEVIEETPLEEVDQTQDAVAPYQTQDSAKPEPVELTSLKEESYGPIHDEYVAPEGPFEDEFVEELLEESIPEEVAEEEVSEEEITEAAPEEEVVEEVEETEETEEAQTPEGVPAGFTRALNVEATAYSTNEAGLSAYTADGTNLHEDPQVIAVDPSVIPLGSLVYIPGYGVYRAADTGGAIVGNRIDVHFSDVNSTYQFGRQNLTIYIQE